MTRKLFVFSNPKDTWNILKQLTGEQIFYEVNDETYLDASFAHDRSEPELEQLSLPMSTAPEDFINEVNVAKAFQSRKLKSSSGCDGLSNLPLKYAARELSTVFTDLFQLSICTGELPDSWRTARITPLPKRIIFGCLSKNASDWVQSGAP